MSETDADGRRRNSVRMALSALFKTLSEFACQKMSVADQYSFECLRDKVFRDTVSWLSKGSFDKETLPLYDTYALGAGPVLWSCLRYSTPAQPALLLFHAGLIVLHQLEVVHLSVGIPVTDKSLEVLKTLGADLHDCRHPFLKIGRLPSFNRLHGTFRGGLLARSAHGRPGQQVLRQRSCL
jgi:hypothetical protein